MNSVQRFVDWCKGPKSDLALFLVLVALLNAVGARSFFRFDLTARGSYSLSAVSRETVKTLESPLGVKVFFSDQLPAPYNSVSRYLEDLLTEYRGAGNRYLSVESYDMAKAENQQLASGYGLQMVQLQEVKDNEVGIKNAWMGMVILYADGIETLDGLTSAEGLEYRITTTIGKMVSKAATLSGLTDKVRMTLYLSPGLGNFGISGFDKVKSEVAAAWGRANAKNLDRIEFETREPATSSEVADLAARYGLPTISWGQAGTAEEGSGVIGLILEYGDRFRSVPLSVSRTLFGYGVVGLDGLDSGISDALQSLMTRSAKVGYVTGHGELSLEDPQAGAANFSSVVSDMYEFQPLDLSEGDIPASLTSVVVNGPKTRFSETELYRLDQFVARGGNLLLFLDPFEEVQDQQMAMYGLPPTYNPVDTGLERLLDAWGVSVPPAYVLDKTCYMARQQGAGSIPLYYVPLLGTSGLNRKNPISRGLADVLMLATGEVSLAESLPQGVTATVLAESSKESWLMSENVSLSPYAMRLPSSEQMESRSLAVLLEGKFPSAFTAPPAELAQSGADGGLVATTAVAAGLQAGKVVVLGSSAITTASVMDEKGQQPVAMLVRNALDYLNGNGDLIDMRTKGLSKNALKASSSGVKAAVNGINLYGLPLLVALGGLVAWRRRVSRRRSIRARYVPRDERETAPVKAAEKGDAK